MRSVTDAATRREFLTSIRDATSTSQARSTIDVQLNESPLAPEYTPDALCDTDATLLPDHIKIETDESYVGRLWMNPLECESQKPRIYMYLFFSSSDKRYYLNFSKASFPVYMIRPHQQVFEDLEAGMDFELSALRMMAAFLVADIRDE